MGIRVGDVGRAVTDLAPGGAVELDSARYPARVLDEAIPAGAEVEVVRGEKTCYVVRRVGSGDSLPGRGEPVPAVAFETNRAKAAREERAEDRARWAAVARRMRRGGAAAAVCGAVAGMASAALGWYFDWGRVTASADPVVLFAGSMGCGAAAGLVLYFFTGWFAVHALPSEADAVFEPDPLAVLAGLVGAGLGFWLNFAGGNAGVTAAWSAGLGLAFAAVACGLAWAIGVVT